MSDDIPFQRDFSAPPEQIGELSPLIRRMVADNPGPYTYTGTCTYIVGRGQVAVIDPGPDDQAHIDSLLAALDGETISHILLTHTHRDHSPGAALLQAACGAPTYAHGPHPVFETGGPQLDHGGDRSFRPDRLLADGERLEGPGWTLEALHTPGHLANHLCFALPAEQALFTGDHVMGWSTSVVAPPEGNMGDYFTALERLLARGDKVYWPAHGGPIHNTKQYVRALIAHRMMRERAILARLEAGDRRITEMVAAIYQGLDPRLNFAAGLSVQGHLEHLIARGKVRRAPDDADLYFLN